VKKIKDIFSKHSQDELKRLVKHLGQGEKIFGAEIRCVENTRIHDETGEKMKNELLRRLKTTHATLTSGKLQIMGILETDQAKR